MSIHQLTAAEEARAARLTAQVEKTEARYRASLAKRDAEVCRLVSKGATMKRVGEHFGLTQQGVGKIYRNAAASEG